MQSVAQLMTSDQDKDMNASEYVVVPATMKRRRVLKMAYNLDPKDKSKKLPAIRFSGSYLGHLGFKVGGKFMVSITDDHKLLLEPCDDEAQEDDQGA